MYSTVRRLLQVKIPQIENEIFVQNDRNYSKMRMKKCNFSHNTKNLMLYIRAYGVHCMFKSCELRKKTFEIAQNSINDYKKGLKERFLS